MFALRDSCDRDVITVTRIYGHWVRYGLASFEIEPPEAKDIEYRRAAILAQGYPYLIAEDRDGTVLGYAYAAPYRTRAAYHFTCEDSVYVAPDACGHGVGRALLKALITRCETIGFRLMVAVIGDSANTSSIGLHRALGFTHAGILPAIGWKHGRWVDSVLMVRPLGAGSSLPPERIP